MSDPVITYAENATETTTATMVTTEAQRQKDIVVPVVVGVLVAVLLITAVVLFIICRRRKAAKSKSTSTKATSGVYAETTAPLNDDESKVMLKTANGTEVEQAETKDPLPEDEVTTVNESSPLKEAHPTTVDA